MKTYISILLIPFLLNVSFSQDVLPDSQPSDSASIETDEITNKSEKEDDKQEELIESESSEAEDSDSTTNVTRIELTKQDRSDMRNPKRISRGGRITSGVFIGIGIILVALITWSVARSGE
jgi:hypothetical protein